MAFNHILVRATNWVGDAVMSIPALQALRREFPHARIGILARPWVAALYGRESFCDELIPYDVPSGWKALPAKLRIARDLRRRQFDAAILLQNAFEAAALVSAAGIAVRIGYDRDGRGPLLTHRIPVPKPGEIPLHQRFYYLALMQRSGLVPGIVTSHSIRLEGAPEAAALGRITFAEKGLSGTVIGLAPGAAFGGAKRWMPERFAQAALQVARQRGGSIAIFGSHAERAICESVASAVTDGGGQCRNLAGCTTLAQFIECAAACEVFLTNDSGPMHIASALGVPTVAVFGATNHTATGPTGSNARVVRHPVACSPCLLRECPIDHRCMMGVEAHAVADEALALLAEH